MTFLCRHCLATPDQCARLGEIDPYGDCCDRCSHVTARQEVAL